MGLSNDQLRWGDTEGLDGIPAVADAFSAASGQEQTISIVDLISEGPIEGLVNGQASIFLDNDRIAPLQESAQKLSSIATTIDITNGSASATINTNGQNISLSQGNNSKFLRVEDVYSTTNVTVAAISSSSSPSADTAQKQYTLTTGGAFFVSDMVDSDLGIISENRRYTRLTLNGTTIEGRIVAVNSTTEAVFETDLRSNAYDGVTAYTYNLGVDLLLQVSDISGSTVTLSSNASIATGTYNCDFTGSVTSASTYTASSVGNYKEVTTQFRVGELNQIPLKKHNGVGNTAITNPSFSTVALEQATTFGGAAAATVLIGTTSTHFGLSSAQASEVDEIRFITTYPRLLIRNKANGQTGEGFARYRYELDVKRDGAWEGYQTIEESELHRGNFTSSRTFEYTINMESYKPFEDFRLRVSRRTPHEGEASDLNGNLLGADFEQFSSASITSVTSIIKEPLSFPYTAYAAVTFSSKDFSRAPSRTYHCRGLKVLVPSNYITREESTTGVATYNRNVSTGAVESEYQDWDGAFRAEKVYTNNPAWVFYDMVTNNRYGLGNWVTSSDIDIYSLYRIARYCDELVSDGAGGQEPRFTANLYLTKSVDAYKLLKDMATIFRGMLYWMDGALVPIIDQPRDPVYTFSKANVIDGVFEYENSGSKTRVNQVIVSWNNPDSDYRLEPLLVEDKTSILKTGKIISEQAVAFGTTSEGQALRFGRWKLWTSLNQTEIVSFRTATNSVFVRPGDIVTIQDANRYAIQYSGRISNTGTLSTTQVPLDRTVTLNAGSTYELSVLIPKPGAFLAQDTATIGATTYTKGDLIIQAYVGGVLQDIDSKEDCVNARASAVATEALQLVWSENLRVETQPVSTSAGDVSALTVSTAFSQAPEASNIWALREFNGDGATVLGSSKDYKVLAVSEDSKDTYSITAVEHYNEKFDSIDDDFNAFIEDPVFPPAKATDTVPAPQNIYVARDIDWDTGLHKVDIKWEPPAGVTIDGVYEHLASYEIEHNFPNYDDVIFVGKDRRSFTFEGIPNGSYTVGIRTVNTIKNRSTFASVDFALGGAFESTVLRGPTGIPIGGTLNTTAYISETGTAKFNSNTYSFSPPAKPFYPFSVSSGGSDTYIQDVSDIPVVDYSLLDPIDRELQSYYMIFDYSDTSDPLKLMKYKLDDSIEIDYWYDVGTGNSTADSTFVGNTGTVTVSGTTVTGSGTTFTTEYQQDDIIKFSSTEAAIVVSVVSDTSMIIDRSFTSTISGSSHSRQGYRPDKTFDAILGRIWNDTTDGFQAISYVNYTQGNFSDIYDITLADPVTPKLFIQLSDDRTQADIRIDTSYSDPNGTKPDALAIFYSVDDIPNNLTLGTDSSTEIEVASVNIEGQFTKTIESGSTTNAVKVNNSNLEIDLSGMWWIEVESGINGNSGYYKVIEAASDTLYINPEESFGFTPQAGDTLHIAEISFHDSRLNEFKLGYVNGEVIKHNGIKSDDGGLTYYIDVVTRGAEGTSESDQTGGTFEYYPAFGVDTQVIEIPFEEFETVGSDLLFAGNIPINVPSKFNWASVTCAFVRRSFDENGVKWLRSNIVPLTVSG